MRIRQTYADFHNAESLIRAIEWARGRGGEVANGIPYWSELASSAGVTVILMAEPGTPRDAIEKAALEVTRQRDVVSLSVMDYSERPDAHQVTFKLPDGRAVEVQGNTAGMSWLVEGVHWMTLGSSPRSLQTDWEGKAIECPASAAISAQLDQQPVMLKCLEGRAKADGERTFQAVFDVGGQEVRSVEMTPDELIIAARRVSPAPELDLDLADPQPGF